MLARIANALTGWSTRWVPDAFVIAILLTVFAFLLALGFTPSGPVDLVRYWGDGVWVLLSFAMQMCLIVMGGYILASSPPFRRGLDRLAQIPRGPTGAVALMAFVSMALAWFNWGLSIVGSAIFVRHLARRRPDTDYRLLVASAYLGLGTLWHAGLSASMPLLVATPGHFLEKELGIIPVTRTIFHPFNLVLAAATVLVMTLLAPRLHPPRGKAFLVDPSLLEDAESGSVETPGSIDDAKTPASRIERSRWVSAVAWILGWIWIVLAFRAKGLAAINLDLVNLVFLTLGLMLHGTPASFLRAAEQGGRHVWGVVVQFPFYAGIFGILKFSGLQDVLAGWFARLANAETYPFLILWYSGFLNYIVPSGGSKWAIEGPYVIQAAQTIGASTNFTVLAYAWGDMLTDIIQPFWAIPLLAIARLRFRDIMGFALVFFIVYAALVSTAFLLLALP